MTTKERIEKEAIKYVIHETGYQVLPEHDHWKEAYIAGATAEHERAQQGLQAYRDIIKELIPIAERTTITVDNSDWREQWEHKRTVIERAKKLIDTVK